VAWLPPELDEGAEPELKPPELELPELELEPEDPVEEEPEPELVPEDPVPADAEPEDPEPADAEPEDPVLAEAEPEEVPLEEGLPDEALAVWVDPGSANATAPAATTPAMPTAVVVERTRARPRSLAAIASRMPFRRSLLM
jgi:hypothetical protein